VAAETLPADETKYMGIHMDGIRRRCGNSCRKMAQT
jgi:hypothetical protein